MHMDFDIAYLYFVNKLYERRGHNDYRTSNDTICINR